MSWVASDFAGALVAQGRDTPGTLAFSFGAERLTRGELADQAARLAAGLRERGVAPGDRVALLLPAGLDFVRGFAAVALAGAVPFAISPEIAPSVARRRALRGRPRLVLTSATRLAALTGGLDPSELPLAAIEELPRPVGAIARSPRGRSRGPGGDAAHFGHDRRTAPRGALAPRPRGLAAASGRTRSCRAPATSSWAGCRPGT